MFIEMQKRRIAESIWDYEMRITEALCDLLLCFLLCSFIFCVSNTYASVQLFVEVKLLKNGF